MIKHFVFMHGGGQGSWVWDKTIAALAKQSDNSCRTLALDAPGCGTKRTRDTTDFFYEDVVRELLDDIGAAAMRDVILVGHSQAGTVLPRMAELRPDLFKRLIYVSCSAPLTGTTIPEMIGKRLHGDSETEVGWPVDPQTHSMEERYRIMFCNDMAPEQADRFLATLHQDAWPTSSYTQREWRYDHLATMPTSYVIFLKDLSLPTVWQERFADRLHANRVIRIDAGHQGMITRPHALAEALLAESDGLASN